jgi:hypothetical protein
MRSKFFGFLVLVPALFFLLRDSGGSSSASSEVVRATTPTWAKTLVNTYGGIKLRQGMPDSAGGLVAVGDNGNYSNLDGWAAHFDKDGKILKQMNYSGKKYDRLYSVCASDDKGYMAAGRTQFEPFGIYDQYGFGLLMKLDAGLTPAWAKIYTGLSAANYIPLVIKLKTKGYLAIMYSWGGYDSGLVAMRLDSSGCVVWSRIMKSDLAYYLHEITEILQAADGSMLLVGSVFTKDNSRKDGLIIKIDAQGNLIWAKAYGKKETYEEFYTAHLTPTGDLMVFGSHYVDFRASHALVMKIGPTGTVKWQNLYQNLGYNGFRFGLPKAGGGFFALGECNGANSVRFLFVKGDATGKILSKKAYAAFSGPYPNYYEKVADAFWSSDGGIFLLDQDTVTDGYVAKLDVNGILPKACRLTTVNIARSKSTFKPSDIVIPYENISVTEKPTRITAKATSFTTTEGCR